MLAALRFLILIGYEKQFQKLNSLSTQGIPYEYGSIMHYTTREYSLSGARTIVPLNANVDLGVTQLGLMNGLYPTDYDFFHINLLYGEGKFDV